MEKISSIVDKSFEGKTIKEYLKCKLNLSSKLIKRVKWGKVTVNGDVVTMRRILNESDSVDVILETQENHISPIAFTLDILYEDDYILAVNKPRNMPTHPSRGNNLPTLAEGVVAYMGEGFIFRAINRLDRDTSGIVIIAKDAYTASILQHSMKNGEFKKQYHALLSSIPNEAHGIINAPIAREHEGGIKRVVRGDGKAALTEYEVLKIIDNRAIVRLTLHTGRTHQIRVHMAHIGTPLYSDFLYGNQIGSESFRLHATYIAFPHPRDGQLIELKCPDDFS